MHSKVRKVFGIISYFPDADSDYHRYVRKQRIKACASLLSRLGELWPHIDIMIIAQNWQGYQIPVIDNKITLYEYDRLGILNAQKKLREHFLRSNYDYMIMLDDDLDLQYADATACEELIDAHPGGIGYVYPYGHPLNFCAISKDIFSRVEFPDLDIENSEGLADNVLLAKCKSLCPDQFTFDSSILKIGSRFITDIPSTWQGETDADWDYMINITDALVSAAERKCVESNNIGCIDAVIAYVDSTDPIWQKEYSDYMSSSAMAEFSSNRFRSWGTLKYLLRGIEAYMPFINKVYLVVSGESQVPQWLNTDQVSVVYHKDFIPEKYLPTFSSCTIEPFLGNIPELAEQFIYFNDDVFPINPMQAADFFTDGIPHMKFQKYSYYDPTTFYLQCRSGIDLITDMLKLPRYPMGELLIPEHNASPILKSSAVKILDACADVLDSHISTHREPKNINQYIYQYYQYFTERYVEDYCPNMYMEINDKIQNLEKIIYMDEIKLVCINDMNTIKDYDKLGSILIRILDGKFHIPCRYEV